MSPIDAIGAFANGDPHTQTLPDLLGLIAHSVQADAIQLGIDLGTGYRRDYFIAPAAETRLLADQADPPFVVMRETRAQQGSSRRPSCPSGLVAAPDWVDQRTLPVGTAGRRSAPRSGIALMRSPARSAFKPSERRQLAHLMPHLNCAIALAYELECARQREACALAMLEQADCGYLLLNANGEPLHGNRLAFDLLAQARIRVGHRLQLPSQILQARFDDALACAVASGCAPTLLAPGPPPVALTLRTAAPGNLPGGAQPAPLALTLRSQRTAAHLPECVAQHFGLTPAEFKLCAALAGGASLKACAQNWNRSYDTLRSQLKTILAKTGTHRQAELVGLLDAFRATS